MCDWKTKKNLSQVSLSKNMVLSVVPIRKCGIGVLFEFAMYTDSDVEQSTVAKLLRNSFTEGSNKGFNVITAMQLGLELDSCSFQKEMQMILSLPSASLRFP